MAADSTLDRLLDWWTGQNSPAGESRADYTDLALRQHQADIGIMQGVGIASSFSERTALGVSSFYAGVRAVSETLASLPIVIEERSRGKSDWERVEDDSLEWMLNVEPNNDQNGFQCHQTRFVHRLVQARSITWHKFDMATGEPVGLVPVHSHDVSFIQDEFANIYRLNLVHGAKLADRSEVLDLRGVATDGLNPISPLRLFANQLALSKGGMDQAAGFFNQVPRPGMIMVNKGTRLKPEETAAFTEELRTNYNGWNAGKTLFLQGQLDVKEYKMTFQEFQLLEMLAQNDESIGERIFNLPPKDLKKGVERAEWLEKYTLRPYLIEDEQEMLRCFAPRGKRLRIRYRRDLADLIRADIKTLYESFRVGIMAGFLKINEVRSTLGRAPDPEGEKLHLPQSVFGKPGTQPTVNPMKGANGRSKRAGETRRRPQVGEQPSPTAPDPRFVAVMTDQFRALFDREARAATELLKKPAEFRGKLTEFYARQRGAIEDRMKPFTEAHIRPVLEAISRHEVRLLEAAESPDAAVRVSETVSGFETEAERLAVEILK